MVIPGATGWEVWSALPGSEMTLREQEAAAQPGELGGLVAGEVMHVFSVRDATVMPFKTATVDELLFADLAQMHSERMGMKADPLAGRLLDFFVIAQEEQSATLTTLVLRAPEPGDLPPRSPKFFDYSPRVYRFDGDGIAIWQELGHWVFAFYQNGQLLYAQSTANDELNPDAHLSRDIWLAMTQLKFQGIPVRVQSVKLWYAKGSPRPDVSGIQDAFDVAVDVELRPTPVVPQVECRLLPADVDAQRRQARKRKQLFTALIGVAALIVVMIGSAGGSLWQEIREIKKLQEQARAMEPERDAFEQHKARWRELGPLVDQDQWPVETLYRITQCMPMPKGVIRLREASIGNDEIIIKGESNQSPPIGQFSYSINKSDQLTRFKFSAPPPNNNANGWTFEIRGAVPQDQP